MPSNPEGHDGAGRVCHHAGMDKVSATDWLPEASRTCGDGADEPIVDRGRQ